MEINAVGLKEYRSAFRSEQGKQEFSNWYNRIHQQSKLSYDLRDLQTRFGNTRVAVGGNPEGHPVVFIHGWSGNGMLWEITGSLHSMAARYHIHLVDVIGQPNNSSLVTPPVRSAGYGIWLNEVLDGLGLESCSFVGMSFGGFQIVKLAQVSPERIRHAIFMAPAGFTGLKIRPGLIGAAARAVICPKQANIEHFVRNNIVGNSDSFTPDQLEEIVRMFHISFKYFRPGAQVPYVFSDDELRAVKAPSLLFCGELDALFSPQKTMARTRKHLPLLVDAHLLPGLGHALGSGVVVERLERFIRESTSQ